MCKTLFQKICVKYLEKNSVYSQFKGGETFRQSLVTSHQLLVASHQLLDTSHQSLVTSYYSLVTSYWSLVTAYQSLITSHKLLVNTSHQFLVDVSSQNNICQGCLRETFGGALCFLMLIFFENLKKYFSFTYLIHMFEFTCFRSSHKKLFYGSLISNRSSECYDMICNNVLICNNCRICIKI